VVGSETINKRRFLTASRVSIRVAHASRVLVSASRRNSLFWRLGSQTYCTHEGKSAIAGRNRQHARRVRYPESAGNAS